MDLFPVWLSLRVALTATALTLLIGIPVALLLARRRFPGRNVLEAAVVLPLVLPPTVLGYYLLLVIGNRGPDDEEQVVAEDGRRQDQRQDDGRLEHVAPWKAPTGQQEGDGDADQECERRRRQGDAEREPDGKQVHARIRTLRAAGTRDVS